MRLSDDEWSAMQKIAKREKSSVAEMTRRVWAQAYPQEFQAEFRTGGRVPDHYKILKAEFDALMARKPSFDEDAANDFEWRGAMDDWLDEVMASDFDTRDFNAEM